jgi:hypothetical protein
MNKCCAEFLTPSLPDTGERYWDAQDYIGMAAAFFPQEFADKYRCLCRDIMIHKPSAKGYTVSWQPGRGRVNQWRSLALHNARVNTCRENSVTNL